jgi:hypothetical protein
VYLEVARKRTFAGAIDWPGWSRSGRDEATALGALADHAARYARALRGTRLGFTAVDDPAAFGVVERAVGDSTTDFGAPSITPEADHRPVDERELHRMQTILRACWRAFDAAVAGAKGADLRKGPRGGGRELDAIVLHVLSAETAYLSRLGHRHRLDPQGDANGELASLRTAVLDGLVSAVRDGVPEAGPRGGARWTPRYFTRRTAWHVLDHAWEIEDRAGPVGPDR